MGDWAFFFLFPFFLFFFLAFCGGVEDESMYSSVTITIEVRKRKKTLQILQLGSVSDIAVLKV